MLVRTHATPGGSRAEAGVQHGVLHLPGGRAESGQTLRIDAEFFLVFSAIPRLQPRFLPRMHPELALLAYRRPLRASLPTLQSDIILHHPQQGAGFRPGSEAEDY